MWRKEELKSQGSGEPVAPPSFAETPQSSSTSKAAPAAGSPLPVSPRAAACITQGIRIKGDISGNEDLFVDGTLEGKLDLGTATCTIGPNGKAKADIVAREVIVRGQVDGKIDGKDRVQLWNSSRVEGEVRTERLAIEDGALLRGKVEAGKPHAAEARTKTGVASSDKSRHNVEAGSRAAVI